jgi:hypothetical protein
VGNIRGPLLGSIHRPPTGGLPHLRHRLVRQPQRVRRHEWRDGSDTRVTELFEPPTEQRELVRHCTLSDADLAAIRRGRVDHDRFGYALMLC